MSATILRGDARHLPLADASVDLIVTSPPYFALRSYTDGGQHYDGQIGAEANPAEYIAALIACTREWMRVLKPSGSLFVNLGDKYVTYEGPRNVAQQSEMGRTQGAASQQDVRHTKAAPKAYGLPYKSLMGLPWRYAIRCVDDLGLILRAEVIWDKPNGLPESVTDRVRRSHETWFHFTRAQRYYSAVDAIRQPHAGATVKRTQPHRAPVTGTRAAYPTGVPAQTILRDQSMNPLGALPGSVWEIATEPLAVPDHLGVDHFAAFPTEWPRRIILGWSPSGICVECGEGRRPLVDRPGRTGCDNNAYSRDGSRTRSGFDGGAREWAARMANPDRIVGEACACPEPTAPTRPAVVLDPFGGTGTTSLVADALGRRGVSVDRSGDYCRLAAWRTTDPGQRAKALGVAKPPVQLDGQLDMLEAS